MYQNEKVRTFRKVLIWTFLLVCAWLAGVGGFVLVIGAGEWMAENGEMPDSAWPKREKRGFREMEGAAVGLSREKLAR